MLNEQIFIYSLSTDDFLTDQEYELHKEKQNLELGKSLYREALKKLSLVKNIKQQHIDRFIKIKDDEFVGKFLDYEFVSDEGEIIEFDEEAESKIIELLQESPVDTKQINKLKVRLYKHVKKRTDEIKNLLDELAANHKGMRTLRADAIKDSNKISQFESTLTRTLGVETDKTTTDIIMIRTFRYTIFKSLMEEGFQIKNGDKYVSYQYLTSSAGAIRNKKSIFMCDDVSQEARDALCAGLTAERINANGMMNVNKYNAYTALTMTASEPWNEHFGKEFDIDKCIVVNNFETEVEGTVDHINSDYEITRKKNKKVLIPHTDGAGICLENISNKAFQFRLPFFKGLIVPTDHVKFLNDHEGTSQTVTDVWGDTHDVIKDDIQIIFTKSQFKAWKFFGNWEDYKSAFKKYKCEATVASEEAEEESYTDKTLSYQVLQTLNLEREQLETLASGTVNTIRNLGKSKDAMLEVLAATEENENKNSLQQALSIYPNLLNDLHSKEVIKETKKSMITRAKAGKLLVDGTRRAYIAPDTYAFMDWLFTGNKNPDGLLKNGEVSCRLYKHGERLNVLRSPHLYKEHSLNTNLINDKTEDYFVSNCIYTSVKSLISKMLQFDVDGDDSLICSNPYLVSLAYKQMENVVPLSYELETAKPDEITPTNIYHSLISAYSKDIGTVNNNITKVWAHDVWNCEGEGYTVKVGKQEVSYSKKEALKVIKWLTFESNATIDFCKSLWMPVRPPHVKARIKKYTSGKMPYFFTYAKRKTEDQVEEVNELGINLLDDIIPNTRERIHFNKVVDEMDYTKLLNIASINIETEIAKEIIGKYEELNKVKYKDIKNQAKLQGKSMRKVKYHVVDKIKDGLEEIKSDKVFVTDVLVKYLYTKDSPNKDTLWDCFGDVIVWNLKRNILGIVECLDCGNDIDKSKQRQVRCLGCQSKRNTRNTKMRVRRKREKDKLVTMS